MKHFYLLLSGVFTPLFFNFSPLIAQHSIPAGNGVIMDVDVMGAQGSELGESGNVVIYTSKHNYISTSVSVEVDWTNMDSPCGEGEWYSGLMELNIAAHTITGFNPDGSVSSTLTTNFTAVRGEYEDGFLRASISDGGYPNTSYSVFFWTNGDCATYEDTTRTKVFAFSHSVTVRPSINLAMLVDAQEGASGRDPFRNSESDWEPSMYEMEDSQELPGDDFSSESESDNYGCSNYGRPQYGVNMRFLAPGIIDREYYQPGPGPAIDITRVLSPLHNGIFGKGWKSSLEISALTQPVKNHIHGAVTIQPSRGNYLYFNFDPASELFTAVNSSDTAYFSDGKLVWIDRDRRLSNTFLRAPDTSFYYIETISDFFGNEIAFNYESPGRLSSVTDGAGRSAFFDYNAGNLVESFTTPDGRKAYFNYNDLSQLIKSTDLEGYESEFTYDTLGNITTLTFDGKTTSFEYTNVLGRSFLSALTDALDNRYTYDMNIWFNFAINSITDPKGNKSTWNYDGYGNLTLMENGNSQIVYEYDNKNNLTKKLLPNGEHINYEYDGHNRIVRVIYNNTDEEIYSWNSDNTLKTYTNREGNLHSYEYTNGLLTKYTDPAGDITQLLHYPSGRVSKLTRPDHSNIYYTYDEYGNLSSIADDEGFLARITYDQSGLFLKAITDAGGNTISYTFDKNNRLQTVTMPDGSSITQTFGCCGLEAIIDENKNTIGFSRDALNALTSIILPDNSRLDFTYDKAHYLKKVTNSRGDSYSITYNDRNMPVKVVNFTGDSVLYEYNENNQMVSVTDERGSKTSFTWINNHLYSVTDALNRTRTYIRDKNNRIIRSVNARPSSIVEYGFNSQGRIISKSTLEKSYSYRYDKMGRMTLEKSGNDSTKYAYNSRGQLISITWQNGKAIQYENDATGKPVSVTYPDGFSVMYKYNSGNKLSLVQAADDSIRFLYSESGKLLSEERSNHTTTIQTFDEFGRIAGIQHRNPSDTLINLSYEYDSRGNISSGEVYFPYDFNFTGLKNFDAEYNELNQLISENGNEYSYDRDANLTSIMGTRSLSAYYTDENLIDSMVSGNKINKYVYNGLMQVVKEYTADQEVHLHYDLDDKLLFETDATGNILVKYIYAGQRLIALIDNEGNLYYYHFDRTGNTVALTDSDGEIANAYWYTPSGEKVLSQGVVKNRFTYLGAWNASDEENGFYRMGLRIYDPYSGRFIQRDPKGYIDGPNSYIYGYNNPLLHLDPRGTDVANGTADLFTCHGPVYGDDFISEGTATLIAETVDLSTDLAPVIGDVKGSAKLMYYLSEGDHKKAALEAISLAGGKYLGGKMAPEIMKTLGSAISQEVAEGVADVAANGTFKILGDAAETMMNKPPSESAVKRAAPSYEMGPPVGTQY